MKKATAAFIRRLIAENRLPGDETSVEVAAVLGRAAGIVTAIDQAALDQGGLDIEDSMLLGTTAVVLNELHRLAIPGPTAGPETPEKEPNRP